MTPVEEELANGTVFSASNIWPQPNTWPQRYAPHHYLNIVLPGHMLQMAVFPMLLSHESIYDIFLHHDHDSETFVKVSECVCAFQVNPDYRDENIDTKSEASPTEVETRHLTFLDLIFDLFIQYFLIRFLPQQCVASFA